MATATGGAVRVEAARVPAGAGAGAVREAVWKRVGRWWLRHSLLFAEVVGAQWR